MAYNTFIYIFCILAFSYLFGSISNAIWIGKVFYKIDVRDFGSKNAGGTNVGRVLGKKAAYSAITLDIMKILIPMIVVSLLTKYVFSQYVCDFAFKGNTMYDTYTYIAGLAVCIGHCYPLYNDFKGGKAVATIFGFLLMSNFYVLIISLITFFVVFAIRRIVSISSLLMSLVVTISAIILTIIWSFFGNNIAFGGFIYGLDFYMSPNFMFTIVTTLISLLTVIRHRENIKRLINHTEPITRYKKG